MILSHDELVRSGEATLRVAYACVWVVTEPKVHPLHPCRELPDVIGWTMSGTSYLIECKRTRRDFLGELKQKQSRIWSDRGMGQNRYYLAPENLIDIDELPVGWGLLEVLPDGTLFQARKAQRLRESQYSAREEKVLLCWLLERSGVISR